MASRKFTEGKRYGAWNVTEREYQRARELSTGDDQVAADAYQLVRYCEGQIFLRDPAARACGKIRAELVAAGASQ